MDKTREMKFLEEMMGEGSPELKEWFLKTYGEDPEFKDAIDRLHFNILSLHGRDFFEPKIN